MSRWERLLSHLGRLRYRLLVVNLLVLLVPVAGLEFARIYERELLRALEDDMRHQTLLVRRQLEADPAWASDAEAPRHARVLRLAATGTRTRIRVLDAEGREVMDSHDEGPPEGPEPAPPSLLPSHAAVSVAASARFWHDHRRVEPIASRPEVRTALLGRPGAHTRVGPEAVYLFVTEPVGPPEAVQGVVYAIRSTRPVLVGLYRIRNKLVRVLVVAFGLSVLLTVLLSLTITRPIEQLSRAAQRIAGGEREVPL
ncbi:MAG: histidine kinase, partial [Myxococcales bacterium]|nr:histidine kinase [Myxococcales bacterium]